MTRWLPRSRQAVPRGRHGFAQYGQVAPPPQQPRFLHRHRPRAGAAVPPLAADPRTGSPTPGRRAVPTCRSGVAGRRWPWRRRQGHRVPLIDKIPPVRGRRGRPRRRPDQLFADRAYDHDKYRKAVRAKGIRPRIARRGQPHRSGLGVYRWVIKRTIAWYHGIKRLRIRWERRDDIHEAFLALATCIITYRHVVRLC